MSNTAQTASKNHAAAAAVVMHVARRQNRVLHQRRQHRHIRRPLRQKPQRAFLAVPEPCVRHHSDLIRSIFAPQAAGQVQTAPPALLLYVAILGVFSGGIAYVAWANAFARAEKASQVSNYMFVTPLLAAVFGFLMAGEVPDRGTLAGGGVILLGVLLFNFGGALTRSGRGSSR